MVKKFLAHIRPKYIWSDALRFQTTYGLGGILSFLFVILILTGVLLMFYYIPSTEKAYISLKKINNIIPFGRLIRNIHRLSGDLMIIFSFLHMLRIIFSKAFDSKFRRQNWIIGTLLFFMLFPFNFTGYILPWDSVSYWGATIVLNVINHIPLIGKSVRLFLSGSLQLDDAVLIRFYSYHVFLLPLIFSFFLMVHYYLIRRAGGVKIKEKGKKVEISKLYEKEIMVGIIGMIILLIVCFKFYNAPLYETVHSKSIPKVIKAPWYFASIQFLLTYFNALIAGVVIPLFYMIFIVFFYKIKNFTIFLIINLIFFVFTIIEIYG